MGRKQIVAVFIITFLISCTGKKFIAPNFETITANHNRIAVLPFTIEYLGRVPQTLLNEDISAIEKLEAQAFQQVLYNTLLANNNTKNKAKVLLQPIEITNQKLKNSNGILKNTEAYYCELLGVDAVVTGKVTKERLYTNLSALGMALPKNIYKKLQADSTDLNNNLPQIPGNAERTYTLKSLCSITEGNNQLLWQYEGDVETKWSANEIETIRRFAESIASNFPYSFKITN